MNRILLVVIMFFLILCSGCFDLTDEYGDYYEDWLSKINPDSTGFNKIVEITYNNYQDLLRVYNFLITPDESYFIVNSRLSGIWRLNISGGNPQKISDTLWVRQTELAISNDGSMIAFTARGDIYRVNVDGSALTRLTNTPDDYEDHPDFYPNDENLIYTKIVSLYDSTQYHSICKMDIDGNNHEELITSISREEQLYTYPIVIPDLSYILFNTFGENPCISSYDIENNDVSCIFTGDIPDQRISITDDGSKILAIDYYHVYVIDKIGNILTDINEITSVYSYYNATFSPDGSFIILSKYNDLYIYHVLENSSGFLQYGCLPFCFNNRIYFIYSKD